MASRLDHHKRQLQLTDNMAGVALAKRLVNLSTCEVRAARSGAGSGGGGRETANWGLE
jgi:curli biogenesis system outer membrane secretion channel CsgG